MRLLERVHRLGPSGHVSGEDALVEPPVCRQVGVANGAVRALRVPGEHVLAPRFCLRLGGSLTASCRPRGGHGDHEPRVRRADAPRAREREDVAPRIEPVAVPAEAGVLER
eukprot:scaffold28117_cov64-Phaeocystis_antarctica.AAC.16